MNQTVDHSSDLAPASRWSGKLKTGGHYYTALKKSLKLSDREFEAFLLEQQRVNYWFL